MTSLLLMIYDARGLRLTEGQYFFVAFLIGSNLALTLAPRRFFRRTYFIASVLGMDIVLLFVVIHLSGGAGADLYVLYFLVVFLALPAKSIPVSVMVAFFASLLYGVVTYRASGLAGLLQTSFLIKIPFFFAVAAFGNLVSREARILKLQQNSSNKLTEGLRRRLEETTKSKDKLDGDLRLMQNYNESIVNSIESGVIVTDLGGTITAFNPAAEAITGVSRDEVLLKKSDTIKTLKAICSFMEQGREGAVRHKGLALQTASGESKILGISVYPLKYKEQRVVGTVGIFTDLTEITSLREKVRESEKLSVQQEEAARFLQDLKKPLSPIQRLSELILSEGENKENRDKYAAAISKGIVGIFKTIKEISTPLKDAMTSSEQTATARKDPVLERNLVDANDLLKEVVDSVKSYAQKSGSSLVWNPGRDLPRISGDREQLKNMFLNLVQDSVRASGVDGRILVSTKRTAEGVSVEIRGYGRGLTRSTQAHSLNPFLATNNARGLGRGLATARKIAANYGGTIYVNDHSGRGQQLTVNLLATQCGSASKPDAPAPRIERQTVLVVNDDNTS